MYTATVRGDCPTQIRHTNLFFQPLIYTEKFYSLFKNQIRQISNFTSKIHKIFSIR